MAIKKGVKKKEGENLTPASIDKVINLLEAEKPITKKEACEILNISYNTTRLAKIIAEHKDSIETDKKLRAANRGKPAAAHEIQRVIEEALAGESIASISSGLFRSNEFVKKLIQDIGLPEKSESYFKPAMLPEQCVSNTFTSGQIVWSANYNAMAIVLKDKSYDDVKVYHICVIEKINEVSPYFPTISEYGGFYADIRAEELGNLEHLKDYGIDIYKPYRNSFPKWLAGR